MFEAAGGAALMTLLGSLFKGALDGGDPYQTDATKTHAAAGMGPDRDPFGPEAAQAKQRINNVNNPWLLGALANQDYMREMQQGYINDLTAQATGARSLSGEQAARGEEMQRGNLQTLANSTRDRFAQASARDRSMQELAGLHQNWLLPTRAAMDQERQGAQDMLGRVLAGQSQQDLQAQDAWRRNRVLDNKQAIAGQQAAFGHRSIAGDDQRTRTSEAINWEAILAAALRK